MVPSSAKTFVPFFQAFAYRTLLFDLENEHEKMEPVEQTWNEFRRSDGQFLLFKMSGMKFVELIQHVES